VNILDLGANVQLATDMARFRHAQLPNKLEMESELYKLVGARLQEMGHAVEQVNGSRVGGYQSIMFVPTAPPASTGPAASTGPVASTDLGGYYRAGSDHRKDGQAVGW
jgi:gamma-glutamyltranspeptidase/glutathione hydrolase